MQERTKNKHRNQEWMNEGMNEISNERTKERTNEENKKRENEIKNKHLGDKSLEIIIIFLYFLYIVWKRKFDFLFHTNPDMQHTKINFSRNFKDRVAIWPINI